MSYRPHSAMMLLCLAGACAHGGKSSTEHGASSSEQAQRADEQAETASAAEMRSAGDEPGEQREEPADDDRRVALPDPNRGNGRMASTGAQLPEGQRGENQGATDSDSDSDSDSDAEAMEADNTGVNKRDRESSALTPLDQGSSEADLELTQRIRQAVMDADSLSFTAKNVKIISRDGQVVLRGTVKSTEERSTIQRLAKDAAGAGRVTNEIEVAE